MNKLTLIGGAPLSGKTTLSRQIAEKNGAVELSTDSIRSWMKQLVSETDYPGLFYANDATAEEFYARFKTADSIILGEINQGLQVEKGVIAILESCITWKHLVIEGIAITPEFINKLAKNYPDLEIESIILVDNDSSRIEKRIRSRGLWGPLDSYPSSLIPKEVEWVILYNTWFLEQAQKYGIEVRYVK